MRPVPTYSHAETADHLHKNYVTPTCIKCGGKDHATTSPPTDLPLCCINCRKEHASNYINCNCRRRLLGLNPLPDTTEMQPTIKKTSRNTGKGFSPRRRRSEEHTSELQSHSDLVCRLLL